MVYKGTLRCRYVIMATFVKICAQLPQQLPPLAMAVTSGSVLMQTLRGLQQQFPLEDAVAPAE